MSHQTGAFNLRSSSDAPNLQVENEETIEARSAREKALLDGIQQRFSFMPSIRASAYRSLVFPIRERRLPSARAPFHPSDASHGCTLTRIRLVRWPDEAAHASPFPAIFYPTIAASKVASRYDLSFGIRNKSAGMPAGRV
ncbi:hypothetical protein [Trinickia symbiotica]|uniref:hypothetical protein n=1 Tax=Trinickia symbiotica TaxID=863227 RepID=UPI0015E641A5|nr:hypothetical protein [Trinickia symbiotica]